MADQPLPPAGSTGAWFLAVRPKTLPAGAAPVLLGTAVASTGGPVQLDLALACLTVAVSLQAAANLANDYFDARGGIDRADRLGPTRVTQTGLLRSGQVLGGLMIALAVGMAAGLYTAAHVGWWLVGPGLACLLAVLAYTAGPLSLARVGLGEVAALVFFGPVACAGTHAVLAGPPGAAAWTASLVPGLHAAAIMAVNNLRDRETDARAGKRTLAVRLGERGARLLPLVLLVLGNLAVAPVAWLAERPLALLALLLLPLSWPLLRAYLRTPISPLLNDVLARTGRWELLTCTALAALLVIA